jgi:nondiscriminating glutamyl-tRNA synthetase
MIAQRKAWLASLLALFLPGVDYLAQLPVKSAFIFGFDPDAAHADPENAAILAADSARSVLGEFASRVRTHNGPVTPEIFKAWINDVKAATGVKGKELYHPIRIAITGTHSSPEFDKIIPLIEDGAAMGLAIPTVHDRIEQFVGV